MYPEQIEKRTIAIDVESLLAKELQDLSLLSSQIYFLDFAHAS